MKNYIPKIREKILFFLQPVIHIYTVYHLIGSSVEFCSVDDIQEPKGSPQKNGNIYAYGSSELEEECHWGNYVRGAVYALRSRGNQLYQVSTHMGVEF